MKTVLYVSVTANGYVAQADQTHRVPATILADYIRLVQETGNVINGRKTYERSRQLGALASASRYTQVVVTHAAFEADGAVVVSSPEDALRHLMDRGFRTALVGGGANLDAAFLARGLVDEVYLNVQPFMTPPGLAMPAGTEHIGLRLQDVTRLSDDIVQLRYAVTR